MANPNVTKSWEELTDEIKSEIEIWGSNTGKILSSIQILLFIMLIVGIIALNHFW